MHELGVADEVVHAVEAQARGARVRKVVVELGRLSSVLPSALKAGFELAREESQLAQAELEIVLVNGRARCPGCEKVVELDRPIGRCECGRTDLDWLSGDELRIKRIELV